MLTPNGQSIAAEILSEHQHDQERAVAAMAKRIKAEPALIDEAIMEGARSWVRAAASRSRTTAVQAAARLVQIETREAQAPTSGGSTVSRPFGRPDNTRGLEIIAERGLMDTFILLGGKRLGDATRDDAHCYVEQMSTQYRTLGQRVSQVKALLSDKRFEKGKTVRQCFSNLELARIFGPYSG